MTSHACAPRRRAPLPTVAGAAVGAPRRGGGSRGRAREAVADAAARPAAQAAAAAHVRPEGMPEGMPGDRRLRFPGFPRAVRLSVPWKQRRHRFEGCRVHLKVRNPYIKE